MNYELRKYIVKDENKMSCKNIYIIFTVIMFLLIAGLFQNVYAAGGDVVWEYGDTPKTDKQQAAAMAVDSAGSTIITGFSSLSGNDDFYTVKVNAAGSAVTWSKTYDRTGGNDYATAVAVDSDDNVIVVGYAWNGSNNDIHTIKYSASNGTVMWQHTYDGAAGANDYAVTVAVDSLNNIYVGGYTEDGSAKHDYLILKYSTNGATPVWERTYNGPADNNDRITAITAGIDGIAVTGESENSTPDFDCMTRKYDFDGNLTWEKRKSVSGNDEGVAVGMDSSGHVIMTGITYNGSNKDLYIVKYNTSTGNVEWEDTINEGNTDEPVDLVVDSFDNAFVTGYTYYSGTNDYVTAKYDGSSGNQDWKHIFNSASGDNDRAVSIAVDDSGDVFVTGDAYDESLTNYNYHTVKYTKNGGTVLWQKSYNGTNTKDDRVVGVGLTSSGQPIVAGCTDEWTSGATDHDYYVIKYDPGLLNPPTSLTATVASTSQINLAWADNASNEDGFKIERKVGDFGTYSEIATVGANATSYNNTGLTSDTKYYYRVKAYNSGDGDSYYSNEDYAVTTVLSLSAPATTFVFNSADAGDDYAVGIDAGPDNIPVVTGYSYRSSGQFNYYTVKLNKDTLAEVWNASYDGDLEQGDFTQSIVIDNNNKVIVSGYSKIFSMVSFLDTDDIYTLRYPSTGGTADWTATYDPLGKDDRSVVVSVSVDGANNYVVTGYGRNGSANEDIFVIKYLSSGSQSWAMTPYDGPGAGNDYPTDVAFDSSGNIIVTGYVANGTDNDFFTRKINGSTGAAIWTEVYNIAGTGNDRANALAIDSSDNVYVTGKALTATGDDDFYTIKYDGTNGDVLWEKSFNGLEDDADEAKAIKVDVYNDDVIVAGTTLAGVGNNEIHIIRYDTDGNKLWERTVDQPSSNDYTVDMVIDISGNVYISADTEAGSDNDVLSVGYDSAGTYLGGNLYEGSANNDDFAVAITANDLGEAYVAGYEFNAGGNVDYVVYKIAADDLSAPYPFSVSSPDFTQIDLSWPDNATAEDGYRIERKIGNCESANSWGLVTSTAAGATSYSETGLSTGTDYCYRVRAYKNSGDSSRWLEDTTSTATPSAPGSFSATTLNTTQINLSWTDNTSGETGFKVERCEGGSCSDFVQIATTGANTTSYSDTSVCNTTSYSYRVVAYKTGEWNTAFSSEDTAVTSSIADPTSLSATRVSEVQVNLSWTDNTPSETGFKIERCSGASCSDFAEIASVGTNVTSYNNTGLTYATDYTYRVKAYKTATCGWDTGYSNEDSAVTTIAVPSGFDATTVDTTQIWLQWTDNTGSETGFKIERCEGTGCSGFAQIDTVGSNTTSYYDVSVCENITYRYRVRANNGVTWDSGYSNQDETTTTAKAAPTVFTATRISETQINLAWTDNTPSETGFRIERCSGASCSNFTEITTVGTNVTSYNNTGLTFSTDYTYRVRAYKTSTCGWTTAYSDEATATTSIAVPSGFSTSTVNTTQINLSWTDNTASETGFEIERCTGTGCSNFSQITTVGAGVTSYSDTSVCESIIYRYRVRAYKDTPWYSGYSTESETAATAMSAPTSLSATTASEVQINLSWTDNSSDETGFKIERCTGSGCSNFTDFATVGSNVTSYNNTGLGSMLTYNYRVKAYKTATCNWESAYSNAAEDATTVAPPSALDTTASVSADCNDIRMTGSDGSTLIDYWLEQDCNTTSTDLWVEVPSIANGDNTIYYYYDSPGASSVSSGDDTFEFFDDFRGTTIDAAKWVEIDPNNSFTQNDDLNINDAGSDGWSKALISQQTIARAADKKIYMKMLVGPNTGGNNHFMVGWELDQTASANYNQLVYGYYWNNTEQRFYEKGNNRTANGSYAWDTEYEMKIELKSAGAKYWIKGGAFSDWSLRYENSNYSDATMRVAFTQHSHQAYVHFITVMKFAATEPTISEGSTEIGSYVFGSDTFNARKPITVSNSGSTLTDHQVLLSLDTTSLAFDKIAMTWTDNSASETEFRIERCAGASCSDFAQIDTVGADETAYTDNTVDIDTTYCYRIKAAKSGEWASDPSTASCLATSSRTAPTLLSATAIDENQVDLSWTDNTTDETGFKVERCSGASCSNFSEIAVLDANANSYSDTTVCNATEYTYQVKAYNAGAWSTDYDTDSVTTPTPGVPGSFDATGVSEVIIDLSWTDNSINETGFKIERCEGASCSNFVEIDTVGTDITDYTDTGLTPSTTYEYQIKAYSEASCTWETAYAVVTGNTLAPPPPTNLSASSPNTTQINLTWTDNTDSETGFRIQRCEGTGCSDYTDLTTPAPDVTSYSDTTVCNGTTYRYQIRAEKSDGPIWNSTWSTPDETATAAITAPSVLLATWVSEVQINLSWADNTSDETGFKIERCEGSGCSDFAQIDLVGANVTSYNNTGLTYSTDYTYRVRAYKTATCAWNTVYSNESSASTTITAPSAFSAVTVNTTQINLSWTDQSGSETGFKIERCEGTGCSSFSQIEAVGANVTSYSDTSVCEGITYRYRVKAYKDATWDSGYSTEKETTTIAKAAPTVLSATRISEVQINLSWTDNSNDETGFKIERCSGASCSSFSEITTVGANVTTYNNTGLTFSTDYTYRVRSYKTATCSWDSVYTNEDSATTSIADPTVLSAITIDTTRIDLSWTDNTADETGFKIERCTGSGCSGFAQIDTVGANVSSYADTSVCNTTDYNYRVRAYKTAAWDSGYSNSDNAVTDGLSAPGSFSASTVSYSQMDLAWTDNMSDETGFKIERCTGSGCSSFSELATPGSNVTSYNDTTVSPSSTYCYKVRTYKTATCGWNSGYSSSSCDQSYPNTPTDLAVTADNSLSLTLNWTDNASTEEGYEIEVKLVSGEFVKVAITAADATTYTDVNAIQESTEYTYRIRAFRGPHKSPYSNEAFDTTTAYSEGDDTCSRTEPIPMPTCLSGETIFNFSETTGSVNISDSQSFYWGTANDPGASIPGDGYFYGDGTDNLINFTDDTTCLKATTALTLEARIKVAGTAGTANTIQRIIDRSGDNYQMSVWRNSSWNPPFDPPSGVAVIAFWMRVADDNGTSTWKLVMSDYDTCPIVDDHWYKVKMVWNTNKAGGTGGQYFVPADLYIEDQGTSGADTPGYTNCTDTDQSQLLDNNKLFTNDSILSSDYTFHIGADKNGSNRFYGLIDWIKVKSTID